MDSILLLLLGIAWLFLFPLVTITTGELKTRGTYFSENGLQPLSAALSFSDADLDWVAEYDARYARAVERLGHSRRAVGEWVRASLGVIVLI